MSTRTLLAVVELFVVCFLSWPASAGIINGSFETGDTAGWTATGNLGVVSSEGATDGIYACSFNSGNTTPNGVLSQTFTTVSGYTYTLTFDFGNFGEGGVIQGLRVRLVGTSPIVTQDYFDGTPVGANSSAVYQSYSLPFVADSSSTTLSFSDIANGTNSSDGMLDNVVVGPVPEPATVSLLALGGLAMLRRRKP